MRIRHEESERARPDPARPTPDEPPAPTGGLSVDEWIAARQASAATGSPYGAPPPPPHTGPPPSKKMAGWALGLSLAFCIPFGFLVGFGLAIAVLVKSRDGRDHGRGMAIAALVISSLLVIANIAYVVIYLFNGIDSTKRDEDGNVTEAGTATMDRVRAGDCFNDPAIVDEEAVTFEAPTEVELVPCAEAHDVEAFASFELPDGDYPGDAAVERRALECLEEFERFNGRPLTRRSRLDLLTLMPSPASWRFGDRRILCSVYRLDGTRLTGTLEGSLS